MSKIKVRRGRSSPMVMHKHEKGKDFRARMKWLLDFLNTDIDSLNPIECLKLVFDLGGFITGAPPPVFPENTLRQVRGLGNLVKDRERKFLNTGQHLFSGILEKILTTAKQIGQESDDTFPLREFDRYVIYYDVSVTKDWVFKNPALYLDNEDLDNEDEELMRLYENKGLFVDALIEVLSRFPLSRIKTCQKPDCDNYFYQKTTKSKGDFCSRKCQNWARTNRWRQNHRDDYNKYPRDRRAKAKEDRIKLKCRSRSCGYQGTEELFEDYLKRYSEPEDCPQCKKRKLLHIIRTWEKGEWVEDAYAVDEWEKYVKKFKQGRDNHG